MMNSHTIWKSARLALAAGLAFGAACSSSSESTEANASLDLNAAISQTSLGDISSFAGARTAVGVPAFTVPSFDPTQCPYSSSDQSFTCPARVQNGVTFTLKYFLYDANGQTLAQVNPATTASLRTVIDAVGTLTPSSSSSTTNTVALNHHSDMRLAGLLSSTRTLNGTSRDRDTVTTTNGSLTVHSALDATNTTTNVVLPSSSSNPYPASGTIATDITGSTTFGSVFSTNSLAHSVLTFNGTKTATLAFSFGTGATTTCQIDLSGATAPRC